jgi:hypothetical protein
MFAAKLKAITIILSNLVLLRVVGAVLLVVPDHLMDHRSIFQKRKVLDSMGTRQQDVQRKATSFQHRRQLCHFASTSSRASRRKHASTRRYSRSKVAASFFTEGLAMRTKAADVNSMLSRVWICSNIWMERDSRPRF